METEILRTFKHAIYDGPGILKAAGNNELFEFDVLGLDVGQ